MSSSATSSSTTSSPPSSTSSTNTWSGAFTSALATCSINAFGLGAWSVIGNLLAADQRGFRGSKTNNKTGCPILRLRSGQASRRFWEKWEPRSQKLLTAEIAEKPQGPPRKACAHVFRDDKLRRHRRSRRALREAQNLAHALRDL